MMIGAVPPKSNKKCENFDLQLTFVELLWCVPVNIPVIIKLHHIKN